MTPDKGRPQEARDPHRSLVDLLPDAVLIHSDGVVVFANPAAARLFAVESPCAIVGMRLLNLVHPDDRAAVAERAELVRAGKVTPLSECRFARLDGTIAYVEKMSAPVEFRGEPAIQIVVRDITARKGIEAALASSERRLRHQYGVLQAINRIFGEALVCDTEEQLGRMCLQVLEQLTGSRFGFIGELRRDGRIDDIAISDPGWEVCRMDFPKGQSKPPVGFAVHGIYGCVIAEGRALFTNDPASHPDSIGTPLGHPALTAFLGVPLVHDARTIGMIGLGNREGGYSEEDLEAASAVAPAIVQVLMKQRAERAVRDADRRKSEFLATLSHELRNPLAPIRYAVQLLDHPQESVKARQAIGRQLSHLVRLVDDLLDLTRIESNKIQLRKRRVDLASVVHSAVEAAKPEIDAARHSFAVSIPAEPVWLDVDPDRLAQVITNLLNNAARYTPAGGAVLLTAEVCGNTTVIRVSDTGVGLRAEDRHRVFDMFTQVGDANHGGLGIGLALVRAVVELHGGSVEASSEGPSRGSEFRVTLPIVAETDVDRPDEVPARSGSVAGSAGTLSRLRVLVVDDNEDAAEMMRTFLELGGHEVRVATTGHAALASLSEHPADVGIFDIGLPGMDGYELAQRVRQHPTEHAMHLIAITGWGQEEDRRHARECGFDMHITKPADPDEVLRLLASLSTAGRAARKDEIPGLDTTTGDGSVGARAEYA